MRKNYTIFNWSLSEKLKSTIVISVLLILIALVFAALFESLSSQIEEFATGLPEELQAIVGNFSLASTPEGFVNIEYYSLVVPFTISILGLITGSNMIGKSEENGSLELLLSSPVLRISIFLQKFFAGIVQISLISFSTFLGLWMGTILFPFDLDLERVFVMSVSTLIFGLLFFCISMMVQAMTGRKSTAIAFTSGILLTTYIIFIVSKLLEELENLKYLSPFEYYQNESILLGETNFDYMFLMMFVCILLTGISLIAFNRRDTGV